MNSISPEKTKIGWIGTGVMGASMCNHLLSAGYQVAVYSRTKSKCDSLIENGARWRDSPRVVAESSDVVFSIVGYPSDVRSIYLGKDGILDGCDQGMVVVDMTTSQPNLAIEIYDAAKVMNVSSIDAPVSGGDVGAKNGTLSIMVGGDGQVVSSLEPIWDLLGSAMVHQGPAGSGQHTKMVNQILIATNMIGVCESLLYAHRSGLELSTVMQSVSKGAAGSWSLSNLGPRIIDNNFEPGFFVEHFMKDMGIAIDEANRMGLSLPGLALARQLYQSVIAQGGAKNGTQALQLALCSMSGIDWAGR